MKKIWNLYMHFVQDNTPSYGVQMEMVDNVFISFKDVLYYNWKNHICQHIEHIVFSSNNKTWPTSNYPIPSIMYSSTLKYTSISLNKHSLFVPCNVLKHIEFCLKRILILLALFVGQSLCINFSVHVLANFLTTLRSRAWMLLVPIIFGPI